MVASGVVYAGAVWEGTLYAFDALTGDTLATLPGLEEPYIVSEGSLMARGLGDEIHILRMGRSG